MQSTLNTNLKRFNTNGIYRTDIENLFLQEMVMYDRLNIIREENELDSIIPDELRIDTVFNDDIEFDHIEDYNNTINDDDSFKLF